MKWQLRILLKITLSLFIFVPEIQANDGDWLNTYEETVSFAQKNDKIIVLYFSGSDWCKPCIKLKKFHLESEVFEEFAKKNLALYQADFPVYEKLDKATVKVNEELADKYNSKGVFPLLVFINQKNQEVIGTIGYIDCKPEEYIMKIESLLKVK